MIIGEHKRNTGDDKARFYNKNRPWVDFLNWDGRPKYWSKIDVVSEKISQERSPCLEAIITNSDRDICKSEYSFFLAMKDFMKENLRAIDWDERKHIEAYAGIILQDVEDLFSIIRPSPCFFPNNDGAYVENLLAELPEKIEPGSLIFVVVTNLLRFLEYLKGHGKGGRKIGVCKFYLRKNTACGKVFFGNSCLSDACAKHREKWSRLKADRRRLKDKTEWCQEMKGQQDQLVRIFQENQQSYSDIKEKYSGVMSTSTIHHKSSNVKQSFPLQNKELLTVKEVAPLLKLSLPGVYLKIRKGEIPVYRYPSKKMFIPADYIYNLLRRIEQEGRNYGLQKVSAT